MAVLESFAGTASITRDVLNKRITITTAILSINSTLDDPVLNDSLRVPVTPSARDSSGYYTISSTIYALLVDGQPCYWGDDGGQSGVNNTTTYYAAKVDDSAYKIALCTTYANAVAATVVPITAATSGTIANSRLMFESGGIPGGYEVIIKSSGMLQFADSAVAVVGDGKRPVLITEESTMQNLAWDNYKDDDVNRHCRFEAAANVTLKKVQWLLTSSSL